MKKGEREEERGREGERERERERGKGSVSYFIAMTTTRLSFSKELILPSGRRCGLFFSASTLSTHQKERERESSRRNLKNTGPSTNIGVCTLHYTMHSLVHAIITLVYS